MKGNNNEDDDERGVLHNEYMLVSHESYSSRCAMLSLRSKVLGLSEFTHVLEVDYSRDGFVLSTDG